MLVYLKVTNMAVIESAELEFGKGFICLTGETGAGKSLIVDALGALSGTRLSSDWVRTGQKKAVIEAVFEGIPSSGLEDLELIQDEGLILRREIMRQGRSRSFVNGVLVPNQMLARYAAVVFEIHGQHGQQALLKENAHCSLFDRHVGLFSQAESLDQLKMSFLYQWKSYWQSLKQEQEHRKRLDFIQHQISEIDQAHLCDDDGNLEIQLKKAENAEWIFNAKQELEEILTRDIGTPQKRLIDLLDRLVSFEPELLPYREQLQGFQVVAEELNQEIGAHLSEPMDEEQLLKLRSRQSVLNQLFLKYGTDLQAVRNERARLAAEREEIHCLIGNLEGQKKELLEQYATLLKRKKSLDRARQKKNTAFERELETVLSDLSFPHAHLVNRWKITEWPEQLPTDPKLVLNKTQLVFTFSPNPGEEPKPLNKVASGGELSRVMLALIVSLNRETGKTLVFDEVDAGLGGETAKTVGQKLSSLGEFNQVLCVTHLAQVAQFSYEHWRVTKQTDETKTSTHFHLLDYQHRVEELARLMGGDSCAEGLLKHARKMIEVNGQRNQG